MKNGLLFLVLIVPQLLAQQTVHFSLTDCLNRALQYSYRFKGDSTAITISRLKTKIERSSYFPSVTGEYTHNQLLYPMYNFPQSFSGIGIEWAPGNVLFKSAQAFQLLAASSQQQLKATTLSVIRRVSHLYFTILQRETELQQLHHQIELAEKHLVVARALWQAGKGSELAVLQAQNALDALRVRRIIVSMNEDNTKQELAALLNIKDYRTITLEPFAFDIQEATQAFLSTPVNVQQHPQVQALRFEEQYYQERSRLVTRAYLPEMQFQVGYQVDRDPTAEGNYWMAGIAVHIPLFQWGRRGFQRQLWEAQLTQTQYRRKQIQRELSIQAENLRQRLLKLKELYTVQSHQLVTTRKAFQLAQANYQAGLIPHLDYLKAQETLVLNELQQGQTRLQFLQDLVDFLLLTGHTEARPSLTQLNGK